MLWLLTSYQAKPNPTVIQSGNGDSEESESEQPILNSRWRGNQILRSNLMTSRGGHSIANTCSPFFTHRDCCTQLNQSERQVKSEQRWDSRLQRVMIGEFSCRTQKDTLHFLACSPFSGSKNRHRANTRKVLGPGCWRPHVLGNAISPLVRHQSQKLSFKLKLVGREVVSWFWLSFGFSWSGKTISGPLTCALVKQAAQQDHSDTNMMQAVPLRAIHYE